MSYTLVVVMMAALSSAGAVSGQKIDEQLFTAVPEGSRKRLIDRLGLLIDHQRTERWEKQYGLLSPLVTQGDSDEDHVKRLKESFSAGRHDRLVEFIPRSVSLAHGGPYDVVILGCAKVQSQSGVRSLNASIEAYQEKADWYFSPVNVITPVDGKAEPCSTSRTEATAPQTDASTSARRIILGRVTDMLGNPLAGCRVKYRSNDREVSFTQTDERGEYSLPSLPSGKGVIVIDADGFKKYSKEVYLGPIEERRFNIGLEVGLLTDAPNIRIRGTVRNFALEPFDNIVITARSIFNPDVAVVAVTSKNGRFDMSLVAYGQYHIYASSPGRRSVGRIIVVDAEKTFITDLRFEQKHLQKHLR